MQKQHLPRDTSFRPHLRKLSSPFSFPTVSFPTAVRFLPDSLWPLPPLPLSLLDQLDFELHLQLLHLLLVPELLLALRTWGFPSSRPPFEVPVQLSHWSSGVAESWNGFDVVVLSSPLLCRAPRPRRRQRHARGKAPPLPSQSRLRRAYSVLFEPRIFRRLPS